MNLPALPFAPDAVVFVMDGLMLDSERAIIACLAAAAREAGHDLPEVLWLSMVGHSEAVCRHLLDEAVGEAQRDLILQRSHVLYDAVVAAGVPHRPGIIAMVEFLQTRVNQRRIINDRGTANEGVGGCQFKLPHSGSFQISGNCTSC